MYDIAIIGGGIAGVAAAITAKLAGKKIIIFEQQSFRNHQGHGFILLNNGMNVLQHLGLEKRVKIVGRKITSFELRNEYDTLLYKTPLYRAYGFLRENFLAALETALPNTFIQRGSKVEKVNINHAKNNIESIILADHSLIKAKFYIDAEGKNSLMRALLFPKLKAKSGMVKEILGTVYAPRIADDIDGKFIKFQKTEGGLSIGLVPCGFGKIVWFCQFSSDYIDTPVNEKQSIRKFVFQNLTGWSKIIDEIINLNDFANSYLWNTEDFDTLPYLHGPNAALIGDAAHLFLPFTSQGVNSALEDIHILNQVLKMPIKLSKALEKYSLVRIPELKRIVETGRVLRDRFLQPLDSKYYAKLPITT